MDMNRDEALTLVKQHLKNKNLIKHCLAVEACMQAMAAKLGQDVAKMGPCRDPARPGL